MSGLGERPFGKYVLLERIAAGGMAEVYRALLRGDSGFEKTVALKLVLPDLDTDEQFLRLFRDEARVASTLTHANVIQTFDHGEIEQRLYLALEFVDGLDLGRLIDRLAATQTVMPPAMAAFVVAEAARGLAYAHDKQDARGAPLGIVHRDVSPRNILMSRSGEVKVADFGVARAAGKLFRTATGVVLGKVRYMAPEQMDGRPIDARADIYSLGAILYELITGTRLFRGHGDAAVIVAVSTGKLDAPSTRRPDIPPALASLAMRALALDRERRPARAIDLARELTIFLQTEAPHFTREDLADLVVRMAAPPAVAPPGYDALPVTAGAALLPPDTAPTVAPPVHDTTPVTAATTLHVSDTTPTPLAHTLATPTPLAHTLAVPLAHAPITTPRVLPATLIVSTPFSRSPAVDPGRRDFTSTEVSPPPRLQQQIPTHTMAPPPYALARPLPASAANAAPRHRSPRPLQVGLLLLGVLGILCGVAAARYFVLENPPHSQPAPTAANPPTTPESPTAPNAPAPPAALAPPYSLTPVPADRARLESAVARHSALVNVGRLTPTYALFLTLLDQRLRELTLDGAGLAESTVPPPLAPGPDSAAAQPALAAATAAADAVAVFVAATGELPPSVKLAAARALAGKSAVRGITPDASPLAAATLAAWLEPTNPERLIDLARASWALAAACAPIAPPRRRFAPLACDVAAISASLRTAERPDAARALERHAAAQREATFGQTTLQLLRATWQPARTGTPSSIDLVLTITGPPTPTLGAWLLAGDLDVALRPISKRDPAPTADGTTQLRFEDFPPGLFAPVLELVVGEDRAFLPIPPPPFPPIR